MGNKTVKRTMKRKRYLRDAKIQERMCHEIRGRTVEIGRRRGGGGRLGTGTLCMKMPEGLSLFCTPVKGNSSKDFQNAVRELPAVRVFGVAPGGPHGSPGITFP